MVVLSGGEQYVVAMVKRPLVVGTRMAGIKCDITQPSCLEMLMKASSHTGGVYLLISHPGCPSLIQHSQVFHIGSLLDDKINLFSN